MDAPFVEVVRSIDAQECPDARALGVAIASAHDAHVEVRFSRDGSGWVARIRALGGERVVRDASPTCAPLADATAVAISVMLDQSSTDPSEPAPAPEPAPIVAIPVRREAPPSAPAPSRARWWVDAFGTVMNGANGDLSGGASLEAGIFPTRAISIGLGSMFAAPASSARGPGAIDVSLFAVYAPVCLAPFARDDGARVEFCAAPALGALHGSAHGYTEGRDATRPWAAAMGEVVARGRIWGPLGVAMHLGIFAPFTRESFSIDGVGTVYEARVIGFFFGVGGAASFR